MFSLTTSGSFKKTESRLKRLQTRKFSNILNKYGKEGVAALAKATPLDSGETSASWGYKVETSRSGFSITWTNNHMAGKTPVVILLQYGHGTGTGGYIAGRDFINPAIKPVFDRIAQDVWKAVTSA